MTPYPVARRIHCCQSIRPPDSAKEHIESQLYRAWSSTTGLGLSLEDAPTSGRAFFEIVHPDDRQALSEGRSRAPRDRTDVF